MSTDGLRLGRHGSVGEEDFWTNEAAVNTIKDHIRSQHTDSNPIHVIFQAWCWDMCYARDAGETGTNDYDDILTFNDSGDGHMESWTSPFNSTEYTFPAIHPDNDAEETGHIFNIGALRLAKAMWWLLARMAGWDGQ